MKPNLLIGVACAALLLISSSCEKTDTSNPSSTALVKTMLLQFNDTVSYNYSLMYDNNSRISQMDLVSSLGSTVNRIRTTYVYSSGTVTMSTFNAIPDTLMESEDITLNSQGWGILRATSFKGVYTSKTTLSYDSQGYMTEDSTGYLGLNTTKAITNYTIGADGNVASKTYRSVTNFSRSTTLTSYTYLTDKANSIGSTNMGVSFSGKQNANLIASSTSDPAPLFGPNPLLYTYEYDALGRVSKLTTSDGVVRTYTYY